MLLGILSSLLCIFLVSRLYNFQLALREVNYVPGLRVLFSPIDVLGNIFKSSLTPGIAWSWNFRHTSFFGHTHDVISVVPIISGKPLYYTCSLEVMKQLLGNEGKVPLTKPLEITLAGLFGDSIASSSGEVWRRHRRIVAPSFNTHTYRTVWAETTTTYKEMVEAESWESKSVVQLSDVNSLMNKFTLIIMSRCGFGLPMSWAQETSSVTGDLSFEKALRIVSETVQIRMVLPRWVYKLPHKRLRSVDQAWTKVATHMEHFAQERKLDLINATDSNHLSGDIFTRLVAAVDGVGKYALNETELASNMFSLLFAGHETTAGGLVQTLGYLAIYQDEQEKAFAEIRNVAPHDRDPVFDDWVKLPHILACFLEAQRLISGPLILPRDMVEDTFIKISNPTEQTIVLKKGCRMLFDLVGIHRNPKVFVEPDKFRPSRWYTVSEHDLSMFGLGPRACIGRKFSQTEVLCFLCLLLRDWKLDVVLRDGETREGFEGRVMGNVAMMGTAFRLESLPLKLIRR